MNERLKQIAIKAQVEHCVSHVRLQEFAELIIKECATIADKNSPMSYPDHGIKIKQHFGVE
jgi:hypothetical protein